MRALTLLVEPMISDVDASLSALIKGEALGSAEAEVVFDAPTTEWASRRSGPAIDVFLYDIREDMNRRDSQTQPMRDQTGRITGRRPSIKYLRLSYLVTAWTARPEDEHRLLGQLVETLLGYDRVPEQHLRGRMREHTIVLSTGLPLGQDRSVTDLWSALGGEMKPSLDLIAIAPVPPFRARPAAPPVQEGRRRVEVVRKPGRERPPDTIDETGQPR